ncbi:hypothetical protein LZ31DRAFT_194229 [Colletotrichum somersetense]|nr:hypothetical protein LZ31DRAFT_194229 [Colletotrichum somersetense]
MLACLPACLPTCLPAYLPTCLPTYLAGLHTRSMNTQPSHLMYIDRIGLHSVGAICLPIHLLVCCHGGGWGHVRLPAMSQRARGRFTAHHHHPSPFPVVFARPQTKEQEHIAIRDAPPPLLGTLHSSLRTCRWVGR